tara:strand:+ start:1530 stop:1811 length:282 start_codon:yes stop_codon:yes gene_type:complete
MKLNSLKIDKKIYKIVCAEVFDTNDVLKANIMIECGAEEIKYNIYNNYLLSGTHFDYSELAIDGSVDNGIEIDFIEGTEDWSLFYINISFGRK